MYKRIFLGAIVFIGSFFAFNVLEFELLNPAGYKIFQSFIFAASLEASIFLPKLRVKLLYMSFFILFLMMLFYLMNKLNYSNFLAGLGVGMLTIIIFSYFPKIFKKGFVEKL